MINQVDVDNFTALLAVGLRSVAADRDAHAELLRTALESYYRLRRTLETQDAPQSAEAPAAPKKSHHKKPAPPEPEQPPENAPTQFSGFGARRKREIFERLKASRAAHESSINELAKLSGLTESDIIKACSAERLPGDTWEAIAAAMDALEQRKEARDDAAGA